MTKPNCYACIHREDLAGDAHISCQHPATKAAHAGTLAALITLTGKRFGQSLFDDESAAKLEINGNAHGFAKGWFQWPWNFDPVWLESCNGFEPKEWPACPECNLKHNPKHHTRLHDKPKTEAEKLERKLEQGE